VDLGFRFRFGVWGLGFRHVGALDERADVEDACVCVCVCII